jgi:hypothetical protein
MRHALRILTTTSLALTATMMACSLGGGDDDDDGNGPAQGGSSGSGGSSVSLMGGSNSTGATGGTGNTSGGNASGGTSAMKPPECEDLGLDKECGTSSQTADIKTVNMMLVIDKSGSMDDTPDGFDDSKWVSLGSALKTSLAGVADQMNFGLILYPYDPDAGDEQTDVTCKVTDDETAVRVHVDAGTKTVTQIVRSVTNTVPAGGTPTAAALNAAYNYYTTGAGADLTGDKYVLLATDGGPNCNSLSTSCQANADKCTVNLDGRCTGGRPNCCINPSNGSLISEQCLDDEEVIKSIKKLADAHIPTFVVGIPGTEAYASYLDAFAMAGGKENPAGPKYYAVAANGGVDGLADVFSTIVTQLVHSCDIPLDQAPADVNKVNVAIDCELKSKEEPDGGWELDVSGAPALLKLKGTTCDKVQVSGAKRVDLYYGCQTIL